jgi:hypothetical protein
MTTEIPILITGSSHIHSFTPYGFVFWVMILEVKRLDFIDSQDEGLVWSYKLSQQKLKPCANNDLIAWQSLILDCNIFIYSGYAIICERYHKDPLPLSRGCYKRKRILTYTVCFTGACGTQLYDKRFICFCIHILIANKFTWSKHIDFIEIVPMPKEI